MPELFDQNRNYVLGDPELELIGDREKLAQWRHKGIGPAFYRLGRKIVYRGADLNAWASAKRVEPDNLGQDICAHDLPLNFHPAATGAGS